jgi:hypothetical protein
MRFGYTVDAIALTASTLRTLLEITAPSGQQAIITELDCEFDQTTPGAFAKVGWQKFSSGVTTATSVTPIGMGTPSGAASNMTLKHSATVEGAGTATAGSGRIHRIAPTNGIITFWPLGRELIVAPGEIWRLYVLGGAYSVNATVNIEWDE